MSFIISLLGLVLDLLTIAIVLRAILSWFAVKPWSSPMMVLQRITDPILEPIRRILPRMGMLDFSPLVAIIILQLLSRFLLSLG
jgi:YggT family protein